MPESFVQVAPDSTGKKLRTLEATVGANVVQEQMVIPISGRSRTGLYRSGSLALAVGASADAATSGRWWLINPVGSGVAVAVKRVSIAWSATGSAAAATTGPRVTIERMTFTGTASGALVVPARRVRTAVQGVAADAAPVGSFRTASTGMTITAGEVAQTFLAPYMGGTAWALDFYHDWNPAVEDDELVLAAGEGIVCRQADSAAADIRRWVNNVTWEEFTAA